MEKKRMAKLEAVECESSETIKQIDENATNFGMLGIYLRYWTIQSGKNFKGNQAGNVGV